MIIKLVFLLGWVTFWGLIPKSMIYVVLFWDRMVKCIDRPTTPGISSPSGAPAWACSCWPSWWLEKTCCPTPRRRTWLCPCNWPQVGETLWYPTAPQGGSRNELQRLCACASLQMLRPAGCLRASQMNSWRPWPKNRWLATFTAMESQLR